MLGLLLRLRRPLWTPGRAGPAGAACGAVVAGLGRRAAAALRRTQPALRGRAIAGGLSAPRSGHEAASRGGSGRRAAAQLRRAGVVELRDPDRHRFRVHPAAGAAAALRRRPRGAARRGGAPRGGLQQPPLPGHGRRGRGGAAGGRRGGPAGRGALQERHAGLPRARWATSSCGARGAPPASCWRWCCCWPARPGGWRCGASSCCTTRSTSALRAWGLRIGSAAGLEVGKGLREAPLQALARRAADVGAVLCGIAVVLPPPALARRSRPDRRRSSRPSDWASGSAWRTRRVMAAVVGLAWLVALLLAWIA